MLLVSSVKEKKRQGVREKEQDRRLIDIRASAALRLLPSPSLLTESFA